RIAHRGDDALWRHDDPATILPLDLFDGTEAGQRRAGYDPVDFAVTLNIDGPIAGVTDPPIPQNRPGHLWGCNCSLIFARRDGRRWGRRWWGCLLLLYLLLQRLQRCDILRHLLLRNSKLL